MIARTMRVGRPPGLIRPAAADLEEAGAPNRSGHCQSMLRRGAFREYSLVVLAGIHRWLRLAFGEGSDVVIPGMRIGICLAPGESPDPELFWIEVGVRLPVGEAPSM